MKNKKIIACLSVLLGSFFALNQPTVNAYSPYSTESFYEEDQSYQIIDECVNIIDMASNDFIPYLKLYKYAVYCSEETKEKSDNYYMPSEAKNGVIMEIMPSSCDCSNISSLILPSKVIKVGNEALRNADSLKYITVPDTVLEIDELHLNKNTTVRGFLGSLAEVIAEKNNCKFELIGDINSNGKYDAPDLISIRRSLSNNLDSLEKETDLGEFKLDLNLDKKVNILDYIIMKNCIMYGGISAVNNSNDTAVVSPDLGKVSNKKDDIDVSSFESFMAKSSNLILFDPESENKNPVYSPVSVYMALSQVAEAADNNTLKEMLDVLSSESIETLRTSNQDLFEALYFDDFSKYCKLANSIWINNKYVINDKILKTLADSYYSASFVENFADEKSADKIADWINKNTSGKLRPVIKNDKDEILKIVNTITFKNKWVSEFSKSSEDIFHVSDNEEISCDFLKKTITEGSVGFSNNYMKYALSMDDGFKMNFILPDEGKTPEDIISDVDQMKEIINDDMTYGKRKVIFSVPKFNVSSKYNLNETAKKLGIIDAFDNDRADFSKLMDFEKNKIPGAKIGEISHEATLAIDEKGCEAAAYTLVSMVPTCSMPPENEPVNFELTRPFFYYISDKNGIPVFFGVINNPTVK